MSTQNQNQQKPIGLNRNWLIMAGLSGLLVGLSFAWLIWKKPPQNTPADTVSAVAPKAAPVRGPAPASAPKPAVHSENISVTHEPAIPVDQLNLNNAKAANGRMVIELDGDSEITLTVMPALQKRAKHILEKAEVPYGAMVAMEPSTGRVLGYVEHSSLDKDIQNLAGRANPPAASIFKIVTTAALLEKTRITADYKTCFSGGRRGISKRHLVDDPRSDTNCQTLTDAFAKSTNAIYGKLAYRHLNQDVLSQYANAFGWNRDIPFVFPVQKSLSRMSNDRVELARTSAGFYNTHLSPVHGAMIASAIANDGRMMAPGIVEYYTVDGRVKIEHSPKPMGPVCREHTARTLAKIMVKTTEIGTAGAYFRKRSRSLKGIDVAAKTGSLSAMANDGTRQHFSWWVGFAPAENPRIALSALVVNVGKWRIKSSYLARETMETYFETIMKGQLAQRK